MASASPKFKFSEYFGIKKTADDDWFDPLLPVDTKLFVDPFRLYMDGATRWAGAHDHLRDFFNLVIELVVESGFRRASQHWKAAEDLLLFPEPAEFCLGYGGTPSGLGSGPKLRKNMLKAAKTTAELGIQDLKHFEEMMLFQENIGPDRIGDIVCNVLKSYFIDYTQSVMRRHGRENRTQPVAVQNAAWSREFRAWHDDVVDLPVNPFTGKGVLLTPSRFLRELPTVDPDEFWDWTFAHYSDQIKGRFNYDVARGLKGREIARLARQNPDLVEKYINQLEQNPKEPYDLESDPSGEVSWYDAALSLAQQLPVPARELTHEEFCAFIEDLINEFKQIVEDRSGTLLLWVGDRPRSEKHAQALFSTAMIGFCKMNNVDFSPESNAGRGPVDFKFSRGWDLRAIAEVKLANNSKYWDGLEAQTPQYMKSEDVKCGYFVTIQYRVQDQSRERLSRVRRKAREVSTERGYKVRPIFVDATRKPSASKLKRKRR